MNDLQLDYFLEVANNLSFTETAEKFYISQPAVSKQIKALEQELGCSLFERTNRRVFLTESGKLFYTFFSQYRDALHEKIAIAQRIGEKNYSLIRFGFPEGWNISSFYSNIMKLVCEKYNRIEIVLESRSFSGLMDGVRKNKLDIILDLDISDCDKYNCKKKKLPGIPCILLFSSRHVLASKKNLSLIDFQNDVFLVPSGIANGSLVKQCCHRAGFEPQIRFMSNLASAISCVQNQMGVIVLEELYRERTNSDFSYIYTGDRYPIRLVWRNTNHLPEIGSLVEEVYKYFEEQYV